MAKVLQKINSKKKIFTCDTFEGIPYEDKFSTNKTAKGAFSDTSFESVKETFENFKVSDRIEMIQGKFEDVVSEGIDKEKFSYIFVDCDVYDASVFALNFGFPRLTNEGIISFDDYERNIQSKPRWGMTKAVDDFCKTNNLKLFLNSKKYHMLPYIRKK
jgi:O-methyltransferase